MTEENGDRPVSATATMSAEASSEQSGRLRWDAFVSAQTTEEKCSAWLELIGGRIPRATAAAILVESPEARTFVPVAVWPEASSSLARLSGAVERAIRERSGVAQATTDQDGIVHVAYPLILGHRIDGIVVVETACAPEQVGAVLEAIRWDSAWLANLLGARELDEAIRGRDRVNSVMEATAIVLRHGKFQQALFEVCNELRQRFECVRVAFGLVEDVSVRVVALSEAAVFEKNTPIVKAYRAAMEEVVDRGRSITDRAFGAEREAEQSCVNPCHQALLGQSGARHVLSFPLARGVDCVGVLTLERGSDTAFSEVDQAWVDAFAALVAPIVEQRVAAERSSVGRLAEEWKRCLQRFFGPRHLLWKAVGSAVLLVAVLLVIVHLDYRVTAKSVIEGEIQRVVAAPFEGFVGESFLRAGDTVKPGDLLARLDDRDLKIDLEKWSSERDQYDKKLREAMANHDLANVQVIGAQFRQAEAQVALVSYKLERASLVAPFAGVVVSGDLSQQIGAPVENGKKLFEIAPLQSYRVILQVDEREIRHVAIGQSGRMVIAGITSDPMAFKVSKVTSVATAQDGKNFFRVEALLEHPPEHLRPGMEGVGKVEVGSRRLWWILTHSFTDWLTLSLWNWLP